MRKGSTIGAAAVFLIAVGPAEAQFGAPFGSPGFLTSPEAASGAIGAGAAQGAAQQQQCMQTNATGRDGPRGVCLPNSQTPQRRR